MTAGFSLLILLLTASAPQTVFVNGKKVIIRPYRPPRLDGEPALVASQVKVIEARPQGEEPDVAVLARPWYGSPMVGAAARGARLPVRGEMTAAGARGRPAPPWSAPHPLRRLR